MRRIKYHKDTSGDTANPVQQMYLQLQKQCVDIAAFFKPGVKITIIVRTPGMPERDVLVGDDKDLDELHSLLTRTATRTEYKLNTKF